MKNDFDELQTHIKHRLIWQDKKTIRCLDCGVAYREYATMKWIREAE
jgi:hypothetical protein